MILLSLDISDLSSFNIFEGLAVLLVIWHIIKDFLSMKATAKEQIVREQSWDEAAKVIKEKEKVWDDGLADVRGERKQIVERYDERLDEIEQRIDGNHIDTEAKFQEVKAELYILTECMRAVLEGLHEQGCNGMVTQARNKLDSYLVMRAHEQEDNI